MPHLVSVNVGLPKDQHWPTKVEHTAIDKRPVSGRVRVRALGLDGDDVGDKKDHGGTYQAVYAFAREDLDLWADRLGQEIRDGQFGENLTTTGIDVNEAVLGERWRIGTALLEVCAVRIPCNTFKNWMGRSGFDNQVWVKRFTAEGRPGPYLRVLEEGSLGTGDEIVVEHRPKHGVTVSTMFRAFTTDRSLLPELLRVETMPPEPRAAAEEYVAAHPVLACLECVPEPVNGYR